MSVNGLDLTSPQSKLEFCNDNLNLKLKLIREQFDIHAAPTTNPDAVVSDAKFRSMNFRLRRKRQTDQSDKLLRPGCLDCVRCRWKQGRREGEQHLAIHGLRCVRETGG